MDEIRKIQNEISETKRWQREYVSWSWQYKIAEESIKEKSKILKRLKSKI